MLNKNVWESQLQNLFKTKAESEINIIMKTIPLLLWQNSNNTDLVELYNNLSLSDFIKVCKLFDGKTIKIPRESQIKDILYFSIVYYFKEMKNYDWLTIKKLVNFKVNTISYSLRIKKLNENIKIELNNILSKIDLNKKDKK